MSPDRVLARGPGAGVACRVPNSIACDRIGLDLRTRRPARAVAATIGGRTFRLDDPAWSGPPRHGLRRAFAGFLQPAGLRTLGVRTEGGDHWTGVHPVSLRVRLVITTADGARQSTVVKVPLSPGWG